MDEYYPIDAEQEQPHLVDRKLERAGNQILQSCAAKGVDVIRLFQCADVGPDFYGTTTLAEQELLDELETICFKESHWLILKHRSSSNHNNTSKKSN